LESRKYHPELLRERRDGESEGITASGCQLLVDWTEISYQMCWLGLQTALARNGACLARSSGLNASEKCREDTRDILNQPLEQAGGFPLLGAQAPHNRVFANLTPSEVALGIHLRTSLRNAFGRARNGTHHMWMRRFSATYHHHVHRLYWNRAPWSRDLCEGRFVAHPLRRCPTVESVERLAGSHR
jgi:hypothetical protein